MKYQYVIIRPDEDGRILEFCKEVDELNRRLVGDEKERGLMEENPKFVTEDKIASHDFNYDGHIAILELKRVVVPQPKKVVMAFAF